MDVSDLAVALHSVTLTRASVNSCPQKYPSWCMCVERYSMLLFTCISTQAIVEVGLPKELGLQTVEADHQQIFLAYNIWAWVKYYACSGVCDG